LGGLYIGMSLNLKVSAELEITLWIGDTKISGKARLSAVILSSETESNLHIFQMKTGVQLE
jgi:hypothetical protein